MSASISQALPVRFVDQQISSAPCSLKPGDEIYFDNYDGKRKLNKSYPPICTELVDSNTWIKRYGLRVNKLTYQHILSMIGFKQMQGKI